MSCLYFSLRQRNILILLTSNSSSHFFHRTPSFSPFPTPLLFSNLYCLMESTFLIMLAVPRKTDFCKVPTLYDIPNFFKLHSKSFDMDPSTPIINRTINVSLLHILAISDRSSEWLSSFSFLFKIRLLSTGHATSIIKHFFVFFSITTISVLRCSIFLTIWIQTSRRMFTISF